MLRLRVQSSWFSLLAVACSGSQEAEYDPATLDAYLKALPQEARLAVELPGESNNPGALTRPGSAELALTSIRFARNVNTPAVLLVRTLRSIVELPPTLFDSSKREFVWGPWDNDDGVGKVMLYVRENAADADFRYSYALIRSVNGDIANATPVIWGASTPAQTDDQATGITLWDLEANNDFDSQHDPDATGPGHRGSGRFVMLYGQREQGERKALFNVAVFRDFRSGEDPAAQPADVDYFYGRLSDPQHNVVDFFDSELSADLCDSAPEHCFENDAVDDLNEALDFHAVFVNRGLGRAEATLREGDLGTTAVSVVECWDAGLDRTLLRVETDGNVVSESGACQAPMDQPMSALGLPSLSDIDPGLLSALDCAARYGVAGCPSN